MENLTFIYDRAQQDIDNRTEKGFINASDLNRIGYNINVIGECISVKVESKNDWRIGDIPRVSDYGIIQQNSEIIRNGYAIRHDTPAVPNRPYNTWQKWNDIEHILFDVYDIYTRTVDNRFYCGENVGCNDDIGIL